MKAFELNVCMSFFSLYVIPYFGSKEINHVGIVIEESFNQQPYMCTWEVLFTTAYCNVFLFVQVQNIFCSQLFIYSHFLQYLSKLN